MNKGILIAIIVGVIAVGGFLASPLFYETEFEVTNGPDLRVYITQNGNVHDGIHLEKLKGSRGDQNYLLENVDVEVYNTVVIYCQPFGAYFAQAELN